MVKFKDSTDNVPVLAVGDCVDAYFYGFWHKGTVRSFMKNHRIEVLWDADGTVSHLDPYLVTARRP